MTDDLKIVLLLPSRGRPASAREAVESAKDMASKPDDVIVALRLDNDEDFASYNKTPRDFTAVGPRKGCSPAYEELCRWVPGSMFSIFADDVRVRTTEWDERYRAIYGERSGRPFVLSPADLHTKLATHPCVPISWLQNFGCLWPFPFEHFYSDTFLDSVGREAGVLVRLEDVVFEHVAPKYGGIPPDKTYADSRSSPSVRKDYELFMGSLAVRKEWAGIIKEIYNGNT